MIQTGILALRWIIEGGIQWKIWAVYGGSILYILFFSGNRKAKDYAKISLIGIFFIFNPLFAGLTVSLFFSFTRYFRILWILPIYFVIAIAATEISAKRGKIILCLCTGIICVVGSLMYTVDNFQLPENMYKVPQAAVDVCEYLKDTEEYQKGKLKICVEPVLSNYIRQVDGNITLEFGRVAGIYSESEQSDMAYYQLIRDDVENISIPLLTEALKTDECRYAVIDEGKVNKDEMKEYGYLYICSIDEYEIYKVDMNEGD